MFISYENVKINPTNKQQIINTHLIIKNRFIAFNHQLEGGVNKKHL